MNTQKEKEDQVNPVETDDLTITPELQKRIDEARQACREGRCTVIRTEEELKVWLDSL